LGAAWVPEKNVHDRKSLSKTTKLGKYEESNDWGTQPAQHGPTPPGWGKMQPTENFSRTKNKTGTISLFGRKQKGNKAWPPHPTGSRKNTKLRCVERGKRVGGPSEGGWGTGSVKTIPKLVKENEGSAKKKQPLEL